VIERLRAVLDEASFHRGLALGALVGAAIAGSTIWSRVRRGERSTGGHGAAGRPPRPDPSNPASNEPPAH
jgi:hypothetical protein